MTDENGVEDQPKEAFIFSSSCFHLHCPKRDRSFTSQPTRALANFLAPRAIHLASWPSVLETPIEHNNDARVSYVYYSKSSQTLPTLPNFSSSLYPKFPNPFQNSHKILQENNLPPPNLKPPIYNPKVLILLLIHQ